MNFQAKYPAGPREFRNKPDYEVQAGVLATGRVYACLTCGTRTQFRLLESESLLGVPCCSEECAHEQMIAAIVGPCMSPVDDSPDTGKVAGSTPAVDIENDQFATPFDSGDYSDLAHENRSAAIEPA